MRNYAGIGEGLQAAAALAQVVADQPAELVLEEAVDGAGRRHGARLAIDELVSEPVRRLPVEELLDRHPDGDLRQRHHAVGVARISYREDWGPGLLAVGPSMLEAGTVSAYGDFPGYLEWVRSYDTRDEAAREAIRARAAGLVARPLFSLVLLDAGGPSPDIEASLAALRGQLYPEWELWVAPGAVGQDEARVRRLPGAGGSAGAVFAAGLAQARGAFVLPLPPGAVLAEHALYALAAAINEDPDVDLLYSDEDRLDAGGSRCLPWFKTAWDPELALGRDAVGLLAAYRRSFLRAIGGARGSAMPAEALLYEISLCAGFAAMPGRIRHLAAILCHRRGASVAGWDAEAARAAVRRHLDERGETGRVVPAPLAPLWSRVVRPLPSPAPLVSILMPTRDRADLLARAAEAVLARTDYPAIELVLIDNASREPEARALLSALAADQRVRVLDWPGTFNFAAICNHAARAARGDILVLLNNDIDAIGRGWLAELVSQAVRPEVGAVGAKLLYPDGRVQHAGIVLGPGPAVSHQFRFASRHDPGAQGECALARTVSAVTGACLAVRRAVYFEVGGMNESDFAITYSDIDFCLRIGDYGYRIVWTPFAELTHFESRTRGYDDTPEKIAFSRGEERSFGAIWGTLSDADPYHNPNLLQGGETLALAAPPRQPRVAGLREIAADRG